MGFRCSSFALVFVLCGNVFAHGGGTKRSGSLKGCHYDRKTGGFHCHKNSPLSGMFFKSEAP